jgi:hypothetical protein
MKINIKMKFLIIALSICIVLVGFICYWIGEENGKASFFIKPEISPSGSFYFERMFGIDEARYLRFCIKPTDSQNGVGEYVSQDVFYIRHRIIIQWGEDEKLWVYSGDVGTYYWELVNNEWIKSKADEKSLELAPNDIKDALRQLGLYN